jgi:hypothetical protein
MADKAQTTWTCDRCKAQWSTLADHNAQPERWHRLKDANPPRHAEPESIGDVCEDCWIAFCSWWQNKVQPRGKPEGANGG